MVKTLEDRSNRTFGESQGEEGLLAPAGLGTLKLERTLVARSKSVCLRADVALSLVVQLLSVG